jgi:hypothetical protein
MSYDYSSTGRGLRGVSTWKGRLLIPAGDSDRWSIRADKSVLLDVPKESQRQFWLAPTLPTGLIHGTNFRHAVEFSRSRRTPSPPSRVTSGQPMKHYPVGSAGSRILNSDSNPAPPASHLVAG